MTNGKLIIYVGVPGSGKSTLAAEKAKELDAVLLNRDDLRTELFGAGYHNRKPDGKSEAKVTAILRDKLIATLRRGGVAIDDNTNTNPRFLHSLIQQARVMGAAVEVITVNTPIEEAKRRNKLRAAKGGRLVPEFVIDQMASKLYSEDGNIRDVLFGDKLVTFVDRVTPGMKLLQEFNRELEEKHPILSKDIVIVDIDGTLSFNYHAAEEHISGINGRKDWAAFFRASVNSPANSYVLDALQKIREGNLTIFALTGRQDSFAQETIDFVRLSGAPISRLIMARDGDFRGDYDTKSTAVENLEAEGFTIVHSLDDRPSSIRVWEDRGIMVSIVHAPFPGDDGVVLEPELNTFIGGGFCLKCGLDIEDEKIIHDHCRS